VLGLLAPDVVAVSDGGPDHHAARRPVKGPDRVARLVMNLVARASEHLTTDVRTINGQPGAVFRLGDQILLATAVEVVDGQVAGLYTVVNPDKLL
jgi:RNA polymerase sigma-70 factor (ECF subfamily)